MGILILIFTIIGLPFYFLIRNDKKNKKQKLINRSIFNNAFENASLLLQEGKIPNKETTIRLKKDEYCLNSMPVQQHEFRTTKVKYHQHGNKLTLGKGSFKYIINSGSISSIPIKELKLVNTGSFILTNKRFVIDGSKVESIDFEKIIKVELLTDGFQIHLENKTSPIYFHFQNNNFDDLGKIIGQLSFLLNK